MVALTFAMLTVFCSTIPLVPNIWVLYVFGVLFGFGSSTYVAGCTVWLMELWEKRAGPILQLLDFVFAVGSILCAVILKPFLVGNIETNAAFNESAFNEDFGSYKSDPNDVDRRANLMVPTLIIGACMLPSIIFECIFIYIYKHNNF